MQAIRPLCAPAQRERDVEKLKKCRKCKQFLANKLDEGLIVDPQVSAAGELGEKKTETGVSTWPSGVSKVLAVRPPNLQRLGSFDLLACVLIISSLFAFLTSRFRLLTLPVHVECLLLLLLFHVVRVVHLRIRLPGFGV